MLRKALLLAALAGAVGGLVCLTQLFAAEKGETGTVTGAIAAKGETWIEVRADGQEESKRYIPRWIGGNPDQGGGFEKTMLKKIAAVKIGDHVKVSWLQEEHLRVTELEVVAAGAAE
jgi:hypothetical protein